jgi:hypothetical protein
MLTQLLRLVLIWINRVHTMHVAWRKPFCFNLLTATILQTEEPHCDPTATTKSTEGSLRVLICINEHIVQNFHFAGHRRSDDRVGHNAAAARTGRMR